MAATGSGWQSTTGLIAGIGFAVQPFLAGLAVVVLSSLLANGGAEAVASRAREVALFGLGLGAVWLGLVAAAVDHVVRGRPADVATTLALGAGVLVVSCGVMFGIASAFRGFDGEGFVTTLFLGLTAFTGFLLGRAVIGLTGRLAVAAAVVAALVLVMLLPVRPMPEINRAVRWVTAALPTRWSFEGLLLLNEPRAAAESAEASIAEHYFPGDDQQMGTTACVTALLLMAVGLAFADVVISEARRSLAGVA